MKKSKSTKTIVKRLSSIESMVEGNQVSCTQHGESIQDLHALITTLENRVSELEKSSEDSSHQTNSSSKSRKRAKKFYYNDAEAGITRQPGLVRFLLEKSDLSPYPPLGSVPKDENGKPLPFRVRLFRQLLNPRSGCHFRNKVIDYFKGHKGNKYVKPGVTDVRSYVNTCINAVLTPERLQTAEKNEHLPPLEEPDYVWPAAVVEVPAAL